MMEKLDTTLFQRVLSFLLFPRECPRVASCSVQCPLPRFSLCKLRRALILASSRVRVLFMEARESTIAREVGIVIHGPKTERYTYYAARTTGPSKQ